MTLHSTAVLLFAKLVSCNTAHTRLGDAILQPVPWPFSMLWKEAEREGAVQGARGMYARMHIPTTAFSAPHGQEISITHLLQSMPNYGVYIYLSSRYMPTRTLRADANSPFTRYISLQHS